MRRANQTTTSPPPVLSAERDRLMAILNSIDDGIYIVGRDYRIEFMNLSLLSEMGHGEGRFCYEFFGHDKSNCEHCLHGISSFGPEIRREWRSKTSGRIYEMAVSPIHNPDGTISRLHILRDITARKELETQLHEYSKKLETKVAEQAEKILQQERLALLGEISAGLAHQIRTPLGAIITGIRLLEKGAQTEENKRLVFELLHRETERLEKKLSEFLSYAKPRLPQLSEIPLAKVFSEIHALLSTDRELLGRVKLRFGVHPPDLTWPLDPDQIKEALLNICINALQALGGRGSVHMQAKSFYEGILEILVRDDGPGIRANALPHIFKPFYSGRSQGTGLGLAIAKDIIEHHRGHITVTSLPHVSTTFRITLRRPTT